MDWVAEILWTEWQHSHGLRGNIPVDWVAEIRGIRTPYRRHAVYRTISATQVASVGATAPATIVRAYPSNNTILHHLPPSSAKSI